MGRAVMSIIIRIPDPDTGELSRIELTSDLQAICLDHDMEQDDMLTFMTGQKSLFRDFLEAWAEHPIFTICNSNVISLTKLGVLSCELATQALSVHITSNDAVPCGDQALKLVDMCRKQWGRRRYEFSRINHARQDLTSCWNKTINRRRAEREPMPGFGDDQLVLVALDCSTFVTEFQQMIESKEGYKQPPNAPCEIAQRARHLIAYNIFEDRHYYPNFREALNSQSPELLAELQVIEFMQARLAIQVLEKL